MLYGWQCVFTDIIAFSLCNNGFTLTEKDGWISRGYLSGVTGGNWHMTDCMGWVSFYEVVVGGTLTFATVSFPSFPCPRR